MKKGLNTVEIDFEGHHLAGIDTVQYIYDQHENTLVMNADGIELYTWKGDEALRIYKQAAEIDD